MAHSDKSYSANTKSGSKTKPANHVSTTLQSSASADLPPSYMSASDVICPVEIERCDAINKAKVKTVLCVNYMHRRICPYGSHCAFAHGLDELRASHDQESMPMRSSHSIGNPPTASTSKRATQTQLPPPSMPPPPSYNKASRNDADGLGLSTNRPQHASSKKGSMSQYRGPPILTAGVAISAPPPPPPAPPVYRHSVSADTVAKNRPTARGKAALKELPPPTLPPAPPTYCHSFYSGKPAPMNAASKELPPPPPAPFLFGDSFYAEKLAEMEAAARQEAASKEQSPNARPTQPSGHASRTNSTAAEASTESSRRPSASENDPPRSSMSLPMSREWRPTRKSSFRIADRNRVDSRETPLPLTSSQHVVNHARNYNTQRSYEDVYRKRNRQRQEARSSGAKSANPSTRQTLSQDCEEDDDDASTTDTRNHSKCAVRVNVGRRPNRVHTHATR